MGIKTRKNIRKKSLLKYAPFITAVMVSCCSLTMAQQENGYYQEKFRPRYHFSPEKNWMNDPNGMFYYDGEYHIFYQHNPFENKWGHMSWGHAVSRDMIHWQHLPVAIPEEDGIMIFSGSAVVDWKNTSGFGDGKNTPIVAVYTGRRNSDDRQFQCIAYSLDKGRTWTKYKGNPVIDLESNNFRDPKVFWYEPDQSWKMVVALSAERKLRFYSSKDLKQWTLLSEFGPAGAIKGVWECPDMFPLPVDNNPKKVKWVLIENMGSGSLPGGSGVQYFVGDFDGKRFTLDEKSTPKKLENDIVPEGNIIADFEGADYGSWKFSGEAFASAPAKGKLNSQNPVTGFRGSALVNSFNGGDAAEGKLTSAEFVIENKFINFLIGGGFHPGKTCINLIVDGKAERTETGNNSESLEWKSWEVSSLIGKKAVIEIVDSYSGPWGHILADNFMAADKPVKVVTEPALWADYGEDIYAAVSWSDIPKKDGRKLFIGWMSNWDYAEKIPTSPWKSAMTLPRKLELRTFKEGLRLVQAPADEVKSLRDKQFKLDAKTAAGLNELIEKKRLSGEMLEIEFEMTIPASGEAGLKVLKGKSEETVIGFNKGKSQVFIDRRKSGLSDFHERFASVQAAPVEEYLKKISFHIFVDRSSVEVFANGGRYVLTDLVFPAEEGKAFEFFSTSGNVKFSSVNIWTLKSVWNNKTSLTSEK